MPKTKYQLGFVLTLPVIVVGVVILLIAIMAVKNINSGKTSSVDSNISTAPSASPSGTISPTSSTSEISLKPTVSAKVTVKPTTSPSSPPTPSPTPSSTVSTPSNPYNLTSATGSVRIMVKPESGILTYIPQAELSTIAGFKVLDGRSTDKITGWGKNTTNEYRGEILFSTAPPGPYKVRISYNGTWSDQKDVSVSTAQQAYVEFSVAGGPTPTPVPKPVCGIFVSPESGRTAPFAATIIVGNNSNPYQDIQKEYVDYNGDGVWDYEGASYGGHTYTFQNPGTYSPKAKILGTSGVESDICQTSITIN